jgi:hypothetical protein
MIGHFLKFERSLEPLEIIGKRVDESGSVEHSWLRVGRINIDITSDQFPDSGNSIIVLERSKWHEKWEVFQKNEILNINRRDGIASLGKPEPSCVYERIAIEVRKNLV